VAGNSQLEVEVKFLIRDLPALRRRLLSRGATVVGERIFERNVRYDNPDDDLLRRDQLLRLRLDRAAILTFKGEPPLGAASLEAKVREELEVTVSDFDTMDLLLQRIGFQRKQIYEKYRETLQLDGVEVVLDEMPYGDFVELEGPEAALRPLAEQLDLLWSRRLLTNYLALMERLKTHHDLPFNDVTFANFATVAATIADIEPVADT
jgi:adenylate cyclase class 2